MTTMNFNEPRPSLNLETESWTPEGESRSVRITLDDPSEVLASEVLERFWRFAEVNFEK